MGNAWLNVIERWDDCEVPLLLEHNYATVLGLAKLSRNKGNSILPNKAGLELLQHRFSQCSNSYKNTFRQFLKLNEHQFYLSCGYFCSVDSNTKSLTVNEIKELSVIPIPNPANSPVPVRKADEIFVLTEDNHICIKC
jgi:hypothetical protein